MVGTLEVTLQIYDVVFTLLQLGYLLDCNDIKVQYFFKYNFFLDVFMWRCSALHYMNVCCRPCITDFAVFEWLHHVMLLQKRLPEKDGYQQNLDTEYGLDREYGLTLYNIIYCYM